MCPKWQLLGASWTWNRSRIRPEVGWHETETKNGQKGIFQIAKIQVSEVAQVALCESEVNSLVLRSSVRACTNQSLNQIGKSVPLTVLDGWMNVVRIFLRFPTIFTIICPGDTNASKHHFCTGNSRAMYLMSKSGLRLSKSLVMQSSTTPLWSLVCSAHCCTLWIVLLIHQQRGGVK